MSAVCPGPRKSSEIAIASRPVVEATFTTASSERSATAVSAAGEALQTFPASVARWRSGQAPTVFAHSARSGKRSRTSGCVSTSASGTAAPIERPPSGFSLTSWSSGIRFRSMSVSGVRRPARICGRRSLPPRRKAEAGLLARRATASSTVDGAR